MTQMTASSLQTAKEIMNPDVIMVRDDLALSELTEVLVENEISGAPVQDANGRLVGVVSLADIARSRPGRSDVEFDRSHPDFYVGGLRDDFDPEEIRQLRIEDDERIVRDVMVRTLFVVDENATVPQVAAIMVNGHLHRVLVTQDGDVVGIISTLDLVRLLALEAS